MRFVVVFFIALLVIIGIPFAWWRWATEAVQPQSSAPTRIMVKPGATVTSIGRELETKSLIRSARAFSLLGRDTVIHPGVYDFSPAEPPREILRHLEKSEFATVKVTVPEGFTNRQIAERLKSKGLITDDRAFLKMAMTQGASLKASFPLPTNLEGYLFPDTYQFPLGASPQKILQIMVDSFEKNAARPCIAMISPGGHSLSEAVNVAAMIEREAEVDADRPLIASVIYNRLKKKMKLQIDATVQYARGQHVERLLYRDLEVDSPYNTYKYAGLPLGPICNPGLPSIQAALKPAKSDYLYYVGRPGQSHRFGKTYEEHLKNIAIVRRENAAARTSAGIRAETKGVKESKAGNAR